MTELDVRYANHMKDMYGIEKTPALPMGVAQIRTGIDAVKSRAELLLVAYGRGKGAPYVDVSCTRYQGMLPKVQALAGAVGLDDYTLAQDTKLDLEAFRKLWKTAHWLVRNAEPGCTWQR